MFYKLCDMAISTFSLIYKPIHFGNCGVKIMYTISAVETLLSRKIVIKTILTTILTHLYYYFCFSLKLFNYLKQIKVHSLKAYF